MRSGAVVVLAFACAILAACGEKEAKPPVYAPACNPLGVRTESLSGAGPGQCVTPFPSSLYEADEPESPTGVRLDLPSEGLPGGPDGPIDTSEWTRLSGFSPGTQIIVEMDGGFSDSSLPPPTAIAASLEESSATVIVDLDTGERVAHWAEVDRRNDPELAALIIHPAGRLRGGTRYLVGVTTAALRADRLPHERPEALLAAMEGRWVEHARFARLQARMPELLRTLESVGVPSARVLLAWDFQTAADSDQVDLAVGVRDLALVSLGEDGIAYEIADVDDAPVQSLYRRRITGTFTVPWFLTSADPADPNGALERWPEGAPRQNGQVDLPFEIAFPAEPTCYEGGADMPVLLYGHDLWESSSAIDDEAVAALAAEACVIPATTSWTGWDESAREGTMDALADPSRSHVPAQRAMQAIVSFVALGRTVTGQLLLDAAAEIDGVAVIRSGREDVLYYGNGLGGTFGFTLASYHPDVTRAILGVGGGAQSLMFTRGVGWSELETVLSSTFGDPTDRLLVTTMVQSVLDLADPVSVAPFPVLEPDVLGVSEKQLLLIEGLGDSQVPNLATELVARSSGVPLVQGSVFHPWGFGDQLSFVPSGFSIYEVEGAELPPEGNDLGDHDDNGVHAFLRGHPIVLRQMADFLTGAGRVSNFCDRGEGCVLRD